jgi:hypothetical protein
MAFDRESFGSRLYAAFSEEDGTSIEATGPAVSVAAEPLAALCEVLAATEGRRFSSEQIAEIRHLVGETGYVLSYIVHQLHVATLRLSGHDVTSEVST